MKKKKSVIIIMCAILLIMVSSIILYVTLNDNNTNISDGDISIKDKYASVLENCEDKLSIGNYTIALKKNYYNKATGDACILLSFEKLNGEAIVQEVYYDEDIGTIFIRDNKTILGNISGSGDISFEYENIEGTAYIYACCQMLPEEELIVSFVDELKNISGKDTPEYKSFNVKETSKSVEFEISETPVFVSEAAIVFGDSITIDKLEIVYEDNENIVIIKDGSLAKGYEKISDNGINKYVFEKLKDSKEIACINVNGESFYPNESTDKVICSKEGYVCSEVDGITKCIDTKIDKETNTVTVMLTTTWKSLPEEKSIDMISLKWKDLYYIEGSECKVTYKTGEDVQECHRADSDMDLYGVLSGHISVPIEVESYTYDIGTYGIYIFTSLDEEGNSSECVEKSITAEIVLDISEYNIARQRISENVYHVNDTENGKHNIDMASNVHKMGTGLILDCTEK